ncbi:sodium-dependent phosphate transport protein 2B-like [Centruroides vittatus]|uniref:sodium-dependent phosphate transport protein 2B-like n=1 Tax=Centruroides vittatus TaxID=120091 RepID=UPI00350FCDAE
MHKENGEVPVKNEKTNVNLQPDAGKEKKVGELYIPTQLPNKLDPSRPYTPSSDADTDPWALPDFQETGVSWSDLTTSGKIIRVITGLAKVVALLTLLYFFICSLDFLSSAFRLLGGKKAGQAFQDNKLLQNPIVGLMIGVLATVLVQSSSTSTSIVVTMVGSKLISVSNAIPIIMGANIGTSVTNTIVSLSQVSDRNEFRRAFAAATVHDMFNWLTVIVLLPIEIITGYLKKLTQEIIDSTDWSQGKEGVKIEFLNKLTKPFTNLIIQIDKKVVEEIATSNKTDEIEKSLVKRCCKMNGTECIKDCKFLLRGLDWDDSIIGGIMLIISLVMLCSCLVLMVKLLHSMLRGQISVVIKKVINTEPRFPFSILVGYLAILIGCGMTILVQSSSIFTSALTPLAGVGIISLERIYPLTLGSNVGTTTTSLLAALTDGKKETLQIAFCHLFFNLSGILLFYPIPYMRVPIPLAKLLGNITAKYRWFSIFYLIMMFFVLPASIFALSLAGTTIFMIIIGIVLVLLTIIIIINILQCKKPSLLPEFLKDWNWLPEFMHSLDPLDRLIIRIFGVCKCCQCCLQPQNAHDGAALGITTHQSAVNILESASQSSECHALNGFENSAFVWSGKPSSESTML